MRVRALAQAALLAAVALTIFVLEAQIPLPLPVPGLKLGLCNIVTLFALCRLGRGWSLAIVLTRIVLGNLAMGQVMAMLYALAGGLLSFLVMALIFRRLGQSLLWVTGAFGGLAHNLGQMAVAVLVTSTSALLAYLPVLLLCGILTGAFTGLCARLLCERLPNTMK